MSEEPPLDGPENPQGQPPGDSPGQAPWSNPQGKKPFWRRTAFLMAAPPLTLATIITIVGCVSSSSTAGFPSAAAGSPSAAAGSPSAAAGSPSAAAPSPTPVKLTASQIAAQKAAAARRAAARAARIRAENTPISAAQWGRVIRNPDNYIGDIYTISGTVAEYNLNSNSIATVENAALVAVDANGNDFIVEADKSKLGNVQPGQTFTAKVTVLGVVSVENTVSGGIGEAPDFDASTFTVTG
jgi:hypothetical protein